MIIRVVYFILFGWWAAVLWSGAAYLLCLSIIGLPLGLIMFNRLPQILTLKPVSAINAVSRDLLTTKQEFPFPIRALYFIFLGWHLTGFWVSIALILCITVIGMPLGIMMLNHVPFVLTLKQRY
ncbi:protein of unknown function DUF307 [Syntrophobotulus glycolicus DSM 8271]|uniref:Inner membrane component domain-containing protein n=1 Tax=Syntrophobotulus glycolicus (strain DSM 8271 / FlGlyR) TaxID=645991 RepID=F0T1K8_SYNGF|nr:YccF domain-containing protein [Syntrophobotulus glycolicus]ADY57432.1 protein of unknown function DUF307 [Syntrophobotulus glycolicus DSM 8271]